MIIKWGGELTNYGKNEAERLGRTFRRLYPGGTGRIGESSGTGLLRLHSTYRHDLKIYASDEGRVQMTAAAFAKGFLALEGELPPILVQMVKSANTNGLLDNDNELGYNQKIIKNRIITILSKEKDFSIEDYKNLAPCSSPALIAALKCIRNPVIACRQLLNYITDFHDHLKLMYNRKFTNIVLYHKESWMLLLRRWNKLKHEFKPGKTFDLTKIPDIYDNIKYDIQHNSMIIKAEDIRFFRLAKCLADIIVPQARGDLRC